jgi:hypothetical protein
MDLAAGRPVGCDLRQGCKVAAGEWRRVEEKLLLYGEMQRHAEEKRQRQRESVIACVVFLFSWLYPLRSSITL